LASPKTASTALGASWSGRKKINIFAIRTCRYLEEYPAVLQLWGAAGPGVHVGRSDTPAEMEKKLQRDPDLFLVAEWEGRLVGAVLGGFDGRRAIVYHLAVEQAARGQGIGAALMAELEKRLRQKGCRKAYLLVTYDNDGAKDFYRTQGWEQMELHVFGKELD
jgi:ribosomal protein S18 acetylase RimI-like enzyme